MFTSPSPAWKIYFFTIPEGACAIELENFWRPDSSRCSRRQAKCDPAVPADLPAAADVRLHLRTGNGSQRLHARVLQSVTAAWNHGHQHGVHRNLGGSHAADRRIPVDKRNR